jgi:hypothetical protein
MFCLLQSSIARSDGPRNSVLVAEYTNPFCVMEVEVGEIVQLLPGLREVTRLPIQSNEVK